jgi:hypothetical protein
MNWKLSSVTQSSWSNLEHRAFVWKFRSYSAVNVDRFLKDFFSQFPSVLLSSSPLSQSTQTEAKAKKQRRDTSPFHVLVNVLVVSRAFQ